ncbi:MAG: branched-chain amino acid ABC transporter permease [Candidatus Dadabacteria bacterium]|nr:MAG: branched-chain amino acid ABC transporter permease [Candidatus Dadabacteria bacterium]
MDYFIHLLILICIYTILAQGFNLPFGAGRLFNLAHVAVYSVGAYTTALLSTELGVGFWGCIATSILLAATASILIGGISLKLSGDYFAIGTIAFASVVSALEINWKSLTKGVLGIPGIPRPDIGTIDFYQNINFLALAFVFMVLCQICFYIFFNNSIGRSLKAQAEYIPGAEALGKSTKNIKFFSFIAGSTAASIAGSLYAYYINYIDPSSFSLTEMIFVLTIAVVGRPGSFWGVTISTIFLILLPEPLRFIDIPPSILGPMRQLLYALILFFVVYWKKDVIFPVERRI